MKRFMALLLVLAMCFSLLTGCGCSRQEVIEPAPTVPEETEPVVAYDENLDKALEYLKVHYKKADEKTAFDYDVLGNIRIGDTVYEVVWTVDVGEDIIKIVVNEDGTVTIDINEDYQFNSVVETPYVLTATITGLDGRVVSTTWDRIIPPGIDEEMLAIVDAAYALKEGQALPGTQTLTGTIISVDTMYSEQYQNVTVTIVVRGREDYPIQCFRLKGTGVDKLAVGDIITVTGTLKNWYGTIEFDAGCILEDVKPGGGEPPKKPDDPAQILKDAFALKPGRSLPYNPVELTGTVTEINYSYKPGNDNMSVTINCMGYSIYCFYLYGTTEQLSNMNINDIITVKGNLKNYYGKVEFDHATITGMTNKPKPAQPSDPKQVVDDAYRLGEGDSLRYNPVTLTGKIIDFKYRYTDQYKNICPYIVIEGRENKPIYCFGLTGKGIKEVDIGDTITVRGDISNYYGEIEFNKPVMVDYKKQKLEECPEDPAEILNDAYALEKGELTPYVATLTGAISAIESPYNSQYDNISVWITVEGHEDKPVLAYRTKGKDAKLLGIGDIIEVTGRIVNFNGKIEFVEGSPFKLIKKVANVEATAEQKALEKKLAAVGKHDDGYVDSEVITVVGTILTAPRQSSRDASQWWFDLYDGWNTITCYYVPMTGYETAPMKGDKVSVTGKLVARSGTGQFTENTATATWLESGGLVAPELPDADATLTIPEAQEAAMAAGSGYSSGKYYVKGKIKEIADSEYGNMTIVDADGNELYIYGTYSKDGKTPYSALPEKPVVGKTYTFYGVLGTFNNIPQMRNGWIQELDNKKLDYTKIPADGSTLTIPKANEVAEFAGAIYTDPYKYYVTGKIKDVTADQYGNMTIVDNKGNELYIYGTWTEGGEVRYGNVTGEKPGVGDEITVYGMLGTYRDAPQMQNGWIVGLKAPEVPDAPTASMKATVADGTYVIWHAATKQAATALAESNTYGYLNPDAVTVSGNNISDYLQTAVFTIKNLSNGTVKITDVYGRYLYMTGDYNSFNVEKSDRDGTDWQWQLYKAEDGTYYIQNVANKKYMAFDQTYGSFGAYSNMRDGTLLTLTAVKAGSGDEQEKVEEPADGSTLTIVEANELGLKFANNTYSKGKFYVTGTVSQVVKDDYGNLYIADEDGNTLYIYGSYSEDGNTRYDGLENPPQVGDTITVYGAVGKYNNSAQMKNVKIQGATAAGGSGDSGDDPVVEEPAADSTLTLPEATALGKSKAHDTYTAGKYYVSGEITEIKSTTWGNMYIKDAEGNSLYIYGTYDETGETRYDALTVKPVVGDTVKLYGVIGSYNGTAQMKDGWIIEHTPGEGGGNEGGDDPVDVPTEDALVPVVTSDAPIKPDDKVVIYAPAFNKAMSITKTGFYNVGVDVTMTDGVLTGYADTEVFTVVVNADGSYSFSYGGQNIGMQDEYTSMELGYANDKWQLLQDEDGNYLLKNTVRGNYLSWSSYGNWAGVAFKAEEVAAGRSYVAFYVIPASGGDEGGEGGDSGDEGDDYTPAYTNSLSFASKANNRTSFSANQQVWQQNNITFTNNKAASTNAVEDYENPVRCYGGSELVITYPVPMTQITFNCNSTTYASNLANSISAEAGTVTVDGSEVTVVLDVPAASFTVASLSAQVRMNSIVVGSDTLPGDDSGDSGNTGGGDSGDDSGDDTQTTAPFKNGDQVVIYAPAYNKALSVEKVATHYNAGVDVTITDGVMSGYGETEIFTVVDNGDGTYSFSNGGQNIGMAADYASLNLGAVNDDWKLTDLGHGLYNVQNVGREGYYLEWYNAKDNWSTYNIGNFATDGLFQISFYVVNGDGSGDDSGDDETKPVVAGPFYLGVSNVATGKALYFNGKMEANNGWYLGATENADEAVQVYTETLDGAIKLYFMNGDVKTYIETYYTGTHVNNQLVTESTMSYVWNASIGTYSVTINDTEYYLGTYKDNTNIEIRPSAIRYITGGNADALGVSQYIVQLVADPADLVPETSGDEAPTIPEADSDVNIADAIALGDSMEHNKFTDDKYYVTGTVTEIKSADYGNLYIQDADGNRLYIYGSYSEDGQTGFAGLENPPQVGDTIKVYGVIGNYNGAQMKNVWIEGTVAKEIEADIPEANSTLTIPQAIELGSAHSHNTYTAGKYYVTGKIVKIESAEKYGNITVEDADGNQLLIFGTYSADGSVRYGSLETKPAVGDTITVYGIIGQYNGSPQMKNGWITEHAAAAVTFTLKNEAVENAPVVEKVPVEETPVEETPVEEVPVEETPVEEVPVEETPAEEVPVEETPVEEVPVEETPAEPAPVAEETPVVEEPVAEVPAEEIAA